MAYTFTILSMMLFVTVVASRNLPGEKSNSRVDWIQLAKDELKFSLHNMPNIGVAKNVILFLGDGMGPSDVTAARFLKAQQEGKHITQTKLSFEQFPVTGLSQTHTSDRQVADSAGGATALLCGEKNNFYTSGVRDTVRLYNCSDLSKDAELRSALKYSYDKEKWTGIVTNMRVTHASPSAAYAHSADRNGEANVPKTSVEPDKCRDIGQQLVDDDNMKIRVILGGGREKLYPCNAKGTDENGEKICPGVGQRYDERNITQEWLQKRSKLSDGPYRYITTSTELESLDDTKVDYLMGLFADGHMMYEHERKNKPEAKQPSLTDMVDKAIRILSRSSKGFFLFVEGGLIDKGHHANLPYKALDETIQFAEAVHRAVNLTDERDTLIVVSADHSHVFNIAGYAKIENNILGTYMSAWEPKDKMPYTTLQYVNGPGYAAHRMNGGKHVYRRNLTDVDTTGADFVFDAGILNDVDTHSGEDVAIYARGPMSYLLQGVHQQHYVAHALMYASCVGPDQSVCDGPLPTAAPPPHSSVTSFQYHTPLVLITLALVVSAFDFIMFR